RNLRAVGYGAALELAEAEEALQEALEPALDRGEVVLVLVLFGKARGPRAARLVAPGVPGQERDVRRQQPVAHDMVEVEVVELVRPDLLLRALDLAVLAHRDQLGTDLLIEDRLEHGIGRPV